MPDQLSVAERQADAALCNRPRPGVAPVATAPGRREVTVLGEAISAPQGGGADEPPALRRSEPRRQRSTTVVVRGWLARHWLDGFCGCASHAAPIRSATRRWTPSGGPRRPVSGHCRCCLCEKPSWSAEPADRPPSAAHPPDRLRLCRRPQRPRTSWASGCCVSRRHRHARRRDSPPPAPGHPPGQVLDPLADKLL